MSEITRYVLIDGQYKLSFVGYVHELPSKNASTENIELTIPYDENTYAIVKSLPTLVHKFDLYKYDEDKEEMVCINTEEKTWIKSQVRTNYRDFGNFVITLIYDAIEE